MIKSVVILFNVAVLLLLNAIVVADLKITPSSPTDVDQNSEFTFEITIDKGDVTGFAKIQQELPAGFTAEAVDAKGASFTYVGGKVKFIWMALPPDPSFTVKYKVKVDGTVSGTQKIGGKFSYLEDNERKSVEIPIQEINVSGGAVADNTPPPKKEEPKKKETTPPQNTTTNNSNQTTNFGGGGSGQSGGNAPSCTRNITDAGGGKYKVEIIIKNNGLSGFAKAQDDLPVGMIASQDNPNGANFKYEPQKAKFVWMGVPNTPEIKISYFVEGNTNFDMITGTFKYVKDGGTGSATIKKGSYVAGSTLAQDPPKPPKPPVKPPKPPVKPPKPPVKPPKPPIDPPKSGVDYRVQICAGHSTLANVTAAFMKEFDYNQNAESKIDLDNHEGWIKYLIDHYGVYRAARNRRNEVTSKYPKLPAPFVTAYNNGNRITVQDALMITRDQWMP